MREESKRNLYIDSRNLASQISNCLSDDFERFHNSDIKNWQEALNEIKKQSEDLIKSAEIKSSTARRKT